MSKQERQAQGRRELSKLKDKLAVSRDGVKITLLANIELPEDAREAEPRSAPKAWACYRTEFLYMNRKGLPTEDEQYEAYARVVRAVKGRITIRTLDLGADKQVDSGRVSGPDTEQPRAGLARDPPVPQGAGTVPRPGARAVARERRTARSRSCCR